MLVVHIAVKERERENPVGQRESTEASLSAQLD